MPQVGFGAAETVLVGSVVEEGIGVSVDVGVGAGDRVAVDVIVSTRLNVSDGVGVPDSEVASNGVELEPEMTSALEGL
jgi:hypothetical protein